MCGAVRALLCSTSGAGHLGPLLPFARALRGAGAGVTFVVPAALAASLAEWEVVVADDPPEEATAALWARVAAEPDEAARLVNGELFGALATAAMLPVVERACDELAPRIVLHEPCAYAAPIAAARRGLAAAQVAISLARVEEGSLAHAAPALERIEPGIVARLRAQPYLSRFPAALDPSPFPDTRRYRERDEPRAAPHDEAFGATSGPTPGGAQPRTLPDWWPGDARPLVYATLGSVAAGRAGAAETYRALAAAAARLEARVLLTVGREQDPAMLGPLPPHVRVERWIAQERVLRTPRRSSAMAAPARCSARSRPVCRSSRCRCSPTSRSTPTCSPQAARESRSHRRSRRPRSSGPSAPSSPTGRTHARRAGSRPSWPPRRRQRTFCARRA